MCDARLPEVWPPTGGVGLFRRNGCEEHTQMEMATRASGFNLGKVPNSDAMLSQLAAHSG